MKILSIAILATVLLSLTGMKSVPVYTFNDLTGRIALEKHPEFTRVSGNLSTKEEYIRTETYEAFKRMVEAARKDGINLMIVSGTRTYTRQTEIWEEKWERYSGGDLEKAKEILEYSSMPGTSRHHWGTDIDINSTEVEYFETEKGKREYAWLVEHAGHFGFFQTYIKKGDLRMEGYKEEKWHWSYYPIADQMMRAYKRMISYEDIKGFSGAELAPELNVLEHFVEGVSNQFEPFETPALAE
jgi:LAS superfamily LD-carboxypeptidase LdcB